MRREEDKKVTAEEYKKKRGIESLVDSIGKKMVGGQGDEM